MSPTGPNYAGTAVDTGTDYRGISNNAWSNPSNATGAQDGSSATVTYPTGGALSNGLKLTNFGFNIPSTAIIDGVYVEHYASGNNAGLIAASLVKAGTIITASQKGGDSGAVDNWGSSGSWQGVGSSTDLWNNTSLLPSDINNSGFGVVLYGYNTHGGGSGAVDSVRITIYWHTAPTAVPKRYLYKVYDALGNYLGNLKNVVSDFAFSQDINTGGSQIGVQCASSIDTTGTPLAAPNPLLGWLAGWGYRKKITIPAGKVTSDLTAFHVYVDLSTLGNDFFNFVKSDGSDIRVTTKYGTSQVAFELVSIDTSAKTGELWFRGDVLAGSDNIYYIYYGNSSASAYNPSDAYGSQNVWPNYGAVYHMNNANDSTANANNGTLVNSPTNGTGKVGKAYTFASASSQKITLAANSSLQPTTFPIVLSMWVKIATNTAETFFVSSDWNSNTSNYSGITLHTDGSGHAYFEYGNNAGATLAYRRSYLAAGTTITDGNWHHIMAVMTSNTAAEMYIDGFSQSLTVSGTATTIVNKAHAAVLAGSADAPYLDGSIDEVRIRNKAVGGTNAAWAAASYSNQNSPTNFYNVASLEIQSDTANAIVKNGYQIKVYEYGYWNPNGKQVFSGQIQHWEGDFGGDGEDMTTILVYSDGNDMDNHLVRGSPFTYTLDQTQTSQNSSGTILADRIGSTFYGQTWVVGAGVTNLGAISLYLKGSAHVTIQVFTDATMSNFLGSVTQYVSVANPTEVQLGFANHLQVTAGNSYFFRVLVNSGESITIYFSTANPYANGIMYGSSYAGAGAGYVPSAIPADDLYFKTFSSNGSTTATFTSQEPIAGILEPILNDYLVEGGTIGYNSGSVQPTALTVTYEFNTNTVYEALLDILSICPNGYYFYVDLGSDTLYFKQANLVADVVLTKGYHIGSLKVVATIEQLINTVYFTGGLVSGSNIYLLKNDTTSMAQFKQKLDRPVNNLVTDSTTAGIIAQAEVDEMKDEQYGTVVTVLDHTLDITTLKPGMIIGFNGFGTFVDNLLAQIVRIDYAPEAATLTLGIIPRRLHTAVEQVVRGVTGLSTVDNPSAPS